MKRIRTHFLTTKLRARGRPLPWGQATKSSARSKNYCIAGRTKF
jgi:hypothetical protein